MQSGRRHFRHATFASGPPSGSLTPTRPTVEAWPLFANPGHVQSAPSAQRAGPIVLCRHVPFGGPPELRHSFDPVQPCQTCRPGSHVPQRRSLLVTRAAQPGLGHASTGTVWSASLARSSLDERRSREERQEPERLGRNGPTHTSWATRATATSLALCSTFSCRSDSAGPSPSFSQ